VRIPPEFQRDPPRLTPIFLGGSRLIANLPLRAFGRNGGRLKILDLAGAIPVSD